MLEPRKAAGGFGERIRIRVEAEGPKAPVCDLGVVEVVVAADAKGAMPVGASGRVGADPFDLRSEQ